jgi:hypothetical protein
VTHDVNAQILWPFLSMMLLTMIVWAYMYFTRLGHIARARIDPQELTTAYRAAKHFPEHIGYPADNLRNLFEMPVLFYGLCIYLYVTATVDGLYIALAWGFVALRAAHSAIHCTINRVHWRFIAYMLSAIALWVMLLRALLQLFGTAE